MSGRIEAADAMADARRAWQQLRPDAVAPTRVELLHRAKKSAVCRLHGPAGAGLPVIVKQVKREKAAPEVLFYEQVLPGLPLPTPRWHGRVDLREGRFCWLVLGDAAGARFDAHDPSHRALAARWAAALHTAPVEPDAVARLPRRDSADALGHLHGARALLRARRRDLACGSDAQASLDGLLRLLDVAESHWTGCEAVCAEAPTTLVHGDFAPGNIRVEQGEAGAEAVVFDWEFAGLGFPGRDLGYVDPDAYGAAVAGAWPGMHGARLARVLRVGRLYRSLTAIHWQAWSVAHPWYEKDARRLTATLSELGWL